MSEETNRESTSTEKTEDVTKERTSSDDGEKSATTTTLTSLPSHSPLVFGNYPPLWTSGSKTAPRPKEQNKDAETKYGASAETVKAVLTTTSSQEDKKRDKKPDKNFEEQDASNRHQYLQGPDYRYTHPRLNVFGRDIMAPKGTSSSHWGRWSGRKKSK